MTTPATPASASALAPAPATAKPRLMMIDVAKGIGILLIVLGHNPLFAQTFTPFADLLSAFRLPFFFFISGTMFSAGKRTVGQVALDRADAWLKPVLVVVVLTAIPALLLGKISMETAVLQVVYATGFTLLWTAMWFLPHLWLLYVAVTWLMTSAKPLSDRPWKRALLVVALLSAGHLILQQFDGTENPVCKRIIHFQPELLHCGLPFSADLVPITAAFFLLGHFMSAWTKQFQINRWLLVLALAVMSTCQWFFDADVDFNYRRYDSLLICTLQAISGIYIMLSICSVLARFRLPTAVLSYCGRGSLFILIFHASFILKIVELMPRYVPSVALVGLTAVVVPVLASLVIWNICQRVEFLSLLMLPLKNRRARQPAATPPAAVTGAAPGINTVPPQ